MEYRSVFTTSIHGLEDESDQGSTGSVVIDRQSQASRLTNMKDLEPLSLDGEQDDHATVIADDRENHEASHLTIEALKGIPDSSQSGVAVNVSDYMLAGPSQKNSLDWDHGSRSDSGSNSDTPQINEGRIMKAEETLERLQDTLGPNVYYIHNVSL